MQNWCCCLGDNPERHVVSTLSTYAVCNHRYADGERIDLDPFADDEETGALSGANIDEMLDEGFTIQFFQPQRYSDFLWDLQVGRSVGWLVGLMWKTATHRRYHIAS